jgi:hypothetical protein
MADEVKQEIQEGETPRKGLRDRLQSKPVMVVGIAVLILVASGIFMALKPTAGDAQEQSPAQNRSPEAWKETYGMRRSWELGTVWVSRRPETALGDRKISAKFTLEVSQAFLEGLEEELEKNLRHKVCALIRSVLHSRALDIKKDPKRAELLMHDDIMRGLKMGVNPNDPNAETFEVPFNDANLFDVYIEELQGTRW